MSTRKRHTWTEEDKSKFAAIAVEAESQPYRGRQAWVVKTFRERYPTIAEGVEDSKILTQYGNAKRAAKPPSAAQQDDAAKAKEEKAAERANQQAWADLEAIRDVYAKHASRPSPTPNAAAASSSTAPAPRVGPSSAHSWSHHIWTGQQKADLADIVAGVLEEFSHRKEQPIEWAVVERRFAFMHPGANLSRRQLKSQYQSLQQPAQSGSGRYVPSYERARLDGIGEEEAERDEEHSATEDEGEQGAKFQPWTRDEEHTLTRIIKAHQNLPLQAKYEAMHRDFYSAFPKSARTWAAVVSKINLAEKSPEQLQVAKEQIERGRARRKQGRRLAAALGAAVPLEEGVEGGEEEDEEEDED